MQVLIQMDNASTSSYGWKLKFLPQTIFINSLSTITHHNQLNSPTVKCVKKYNFKIEIPKIK